MKKVLALLALTTSFAAVAAPVAGHAGKASHKGANPAVAKTHGKALKGKAAKGKSVAQDAPQTMETAPRRRRSRATTSRARSKNCTASHLRPINLR